MVAFEFAIVLFIFYLPHLFFVHFSFFPSFYWDSLTIFFYNYTLFTLLDYTFVLFFISLFWVNNMYFQLLTVCFQMILYLFTCSVKTSQQYTSIPLSFVLLLSYILLPPWLWIPEYNVLSCALSSQLYIFYIIISWL